MKLAKNTIKKWSTWANMGAMVVAGIMVYVPDVVPMDWQAKVMLCCTAIVKVCQWCTQKNLEAISDVSET